MSHSCTREVRKWACGCQWNGKIRSCKVKACDEGTCKEVESSKGVFKTLCDYHEETRRDADAETLSIGGYTAIYHQSPPSLYAQQLRREHRLTDFDYHRVRGTLEVYFSTEERFQKLHIPDPGKLTYQELLDRGISIPRPRPRQLMNSLCEPKDSRSELHQDEMSHQQRGEDDKQSNLVDTNTPGLKDLDIAAINLSRSPRKDKSKKVVKDRAEPYPKRKPQPSRGTRKLRYILPACGKPGLSTDGLTERGSFSMDPATQKNERARDATPPNSRYLSPKPTCTQGTNSRSQLIDKISVSRVHGSMKSKQRGNKDGPFSEYVEPRDRLSGI